MYETHSKSFFADDRTRTIEHTFFCLHFGLFVGVYTADNRSGQDFDHVSFGLNFSWKMHKRRVLPAIIIAIIMVALLGGLAYWWRASHRQAHHTTAIVTNGIECAEMTRYVFVTSM